MLPPSNSLRWSFQVVYDHSPLQMVGHIHTCGSTLHRWWQWLVSFQNVCSVTSFGVPSTLRFLENTNLASQGKGTDLHSILTSNSCNLTLSENFGHLLWHLPESKDWCWCTHTQWSYFVTCVWGMCTMGSCLDFPKFHHNEIICAVFIVPLWLMGISQHDPAPTLFHDVPCPFYFMGLFLSYSWPRRASDSTCLDPVIFVATLIAGHTD